MKGARYWGTREAGEAQSLSALASSARLCRYYVVSPSFRTRKIFAGVYDSAILSRLDILFKRKLRGSELYPVPANTKFFVFVFVFSATRLHCQVSRLINLVGA